MNPSSFAIIMACNVVWALNVIVSKWAVDDYAVPPLFYAALRSLVVVAALVPFLRKMPADPVRVMLIGLAISGGSFGLLFIGLQTASPSAAGIVNLTGAPLTVLFAIVILKEEVRWRRMLGMALAFGGVALAVASPAGMESGVGLLYVFAGVVVGALGAVFFKRITIGAVEMQAWAGLASVAFLFPISFGLESGQFAAVTAAPWEVLGCVAFAGLVVSVGAHSAYYHLLQRHDANLLVPLTLMTPLLTIGFGAWLTGDPIGPRLLIGAGLAIAGVAIIVIRPSRAIFKPLLVRVRF
ncbi:DMT family transporter [Erythrobacter sp. SDW2]|uniref:DMT family transporter n=1 Tax=Erythrobacter sp. SDW2 TaxID=2907154 RepID=UPI001F1BE8B1|nr:DMT family transporter [Erythrobacter sp. SDW2]UIP08020.1 DMT family transporter [Erythrobacter sp. SDW2]